MWAQLRRPELRALERLFFECYARGACRAKSPSRQCCPPLKRTIGWPRADTDPAGCTAGLRPRLLLDLAGTDDAAGVDAAAQRFVN